MKNIKEASKIKSKIAFVWVMLLLFMFVLLIYYPLAIIKSYAKEINTNHDLLGIKTTAFNNTSTFARTIKINKHKPYVVTITVNINNNDDLVYLGTSVSLFGMEIACHHWSIYQPCEAPDYFPK